jgi:hypothetical protein
VLRIGLPLASMRVAADLLMSAMMSADRILIDLHDV